MAMYEQPHHYRRFVEDTTTTTTTNGHPRTYHTHREEVSDSAVNSSSSNSSNSTRNLDSMAMPSLLSNSGLPPRTPPPTPVSGEGTTSRSYHYRSTRSTNPSAANAMDLNMSSRSLQHSDFQQQQADQQQPPPQQQEQQQQQERFEETTTTTIRTAPPASHNYMHFDESQQMRPTSANSTSTSSSRHRHIRTGVDTGVTKPPHSLGSFGPRPDWHASAPDLLSSSFRDLRASSPTSDGGFGSTTSLSSSHNWQKKNAMTSTSMAMASPKLPTEIRDLGAYYLIKVEAPGHPGLQARDIRVRLMEDRMLKISGEFFEEHFVDQPSGNGRHRMERNHSTFTKTFTIPENADLYSIQAFVDGSTVNVRVDKKPDLRHEIPVHTRY